MSVAKVLHEQWTGGGATLSFPAALMCPRNQVAYCALILEVMDTITSEALLKAASRFVI